MMSYTNMTFVVITIIINSYRIVSYLMYTLVEHTFRYCSKNFFTNVLSFLVAYLRCSSILGSSTNKLTVRRRRLLVTIFVSSAKVSPYNYVIIDILECNRIVPMLPQMKSLNLLLFLLHSCSSL